MVLSPITRQHVLDSAAQIDIDGIPDLHVYNIYWTVVNGKEYPFKHLTRGALKAAIGQDLDLPDFQSNEVYRNYVRNLGFEIRSYPQGINFFTKEDLSHFDKIGGTSYRSTEVSDIKASELLSPLVYKVNAWARQCKIEDFRVQQDKRWQWMGKNFKKYLWVRSYRNNGSKKVFFIVGVHSVEIEKEEKEGYLYSMIGILDSVTEQSETNFYNRLEKSNYSSFKIYLSELSRYTWESLTKKTIDFYSDHLALYDELEQIVVETERDPKKAHVAGVMFVDAPKHTKSLLPDIRTFKGYTIDWSKKSTITKETGNSGEEFVLTYERKVLREKGLYDLADKVVRKLDGEGYDILSFNELGKEKYIEVKTTTNGIDEPFYFTVNEKAFLEKYSENYFLYRLYEFRVDPIRGKCYILKGSHFLKHGSFSPINYEVTLTNYE